MLSPHTQFEHTHQSGVLWPNRPLQTLRHGYVSELQTARSQIATRLSVFAAVCANSLGAAVTDRPAELAGNLQSGAVAGISDCSRLSSRSRPANARVDIMVGAPAVDFELPDTEGRTHRLADYAGRWLLMVFHRHLA